MATITGLTAARMLAMEAASLVSAAIVGDNLIITRQNGTTFNAGNVRGPAGVAGPAANVQSLITKLPVLEVGVPNQIRAGRQLAATDFTNMGLTAPAGLWNLSGLTDVSGNGRALTDKGSVPYGSGINGTAATAAVFSGASGSQLLFITDTGAADPFRIKTGSWGCWFRTAKRGAFQMLVTKTSNSFANLGWGVDVDNSNRVRGVVSVSPLPAGQYSHVVSGITDVADDYWHFAVVTFNGTSMKVYVDGILEAQTPGVIPGLIAPCTTELNIGAQAGNAGTAGTLPFYGRIDEAFVTADVLSPDQIRNLYCAKVAHSLGVVPTLHNIAVYRRQHAAPLTSDFPSQPKRMYNFTGGVLTDAGSDNVTLTNVYTSLILAADGNDGAKGNGMQFSGAHQGLTASDAVLPAGTATRSYGCWFKTNEITATETMLAWGTTVGTNDIRLMVANTGRTITSYNGTDLITGPVVVDGNWHFAVVVEDNAAGDGLKRKLYLDGRLVGSSTVLVSVTSGGASAFRVGAACTGVTPFLGHIDNAFVHSVALTPDQIRTLWSLGTQEMPASPKNAGDHIEASSTTDILFAFDTLESQHKVDLGVRV